MTSTTRDEAAMSTCMHMTELTGSGAIASPLVMWLLMMVPMMLPLLIPMLWRYQHPLTTMRAVRSWPAIGVAAAGYLFIWTIFGIVTFPVASAMAGVDMQPAGIAQALRITSGVVVLLGGMFQFTEYKARQLACCREAPCAPVDSNARAAWRHGLRMGLQCARCCANLMIILLATGIMDTRAMAAVTAAITAERFAPLGNRIARAIGLVIAATGAVLVAQALNIGRRI